MSAITIAVKGGTATAPSGVGGGKPIVRVGLCVDGAKTDVLLDVQKPMFIGEVPPSWSQDDAVAIAKEISDKIRTPPKKAPQVNPSITFAVKGGTARTVGSAERSAILLVQLDVDGDKSDVRLDVQKAMFIDAVPRSWSRAEAKAIAARISDKVRVP